MKYVLCALAVIVEFIAYALIGGVLGWSHGGGLIPMMLFYAVVGATCRAIIKYFNEKKAEATASVMKDEDDE